MDLRTARAELRDIFSLDLEDDEADRLLNEANRELCVRSGYTRKTLTLASGDPLPDDVYSLVRVKVGGRRAYEIDDDTEAEIGHTLRLRARVYWTAEDDAGVERIYSRPTATITALAIVSPPTLAAEDEFTPPPDFHRAIINYARAVSYGGSEDHTELEAVYSQAFEAEVERLRRYKLSRGGGRARMRIAGVNG